MNHKFKNIILTVIIFTLLISFSNSSIAAINSSSSSSNILKDVFEWIVKQLLSTAGGVLGSTIAPLVNIFSILIFLILYMLFVSNGVSAGLAFPFPDQIVFNKIPLLDPNFINPDPDSIGGLVGGLVSKTYYSFFTLAGTVFIIAAMVIGIKLALSSLAAEKAQYKKALNNWIVGIVLLFTIHYVMAGAFYLNEEIVKKLSKYADGIVIKFDVLEAVPGVGKTLSKVVNGIASFFTGSDDKITDVDLYGYGGIVLMYALKGLVGQDLISSIVFLIIIGQTFGLVITYLKRVFMCIILGMMAPLIVAVDVIKKSMG